MARKFILCLLVIMSLFVYSCDGEIQPVGPLWQIHDPEVGGKAIWGTADNDIWIVGENNDMLHWNGSTITTYETPREGVFGIGLATVWGSSPDDYWAGGSITNGIMHWDGSSWVIIPTPDMYPSSDYELFGILDIWGSSSSDVWAVGELAKVLHWNGSSWEGYDFGPTDQDIYHESFFGVWGFSPSDVWAVGTNATILHWNGSAWSIVSSGTSSNHLLVDIWGSGPNDVWAVGYRGLFLHWDGSAWTEHPGPDIDKSFESIWGFGSDDIWVVSSSRDTEIYHWEGTSWTPENNPTNRWLYGLWGSRLDLVYVVGNDITLRYDYWPP